MIICLAFRCNQLNVMGSHIRSEGNDGRKIFGFCHAQRFEAMIFQDNFYDMPDVLVILIINTVISYISINNIYSAGSSF